MLIYLLLVFGLVGTVLLALLGSWLTSRGENASDERQSHTQGRQQRPQDSQAIEWDDRAPLRQPTSLGIVLAQRQPGSGGVELGQLAQLLIWAQQAGVRKALLYDPQGWLQWQQRQLEKALQPAACRSDGSVLVAVHVGWPDSADSQQLDLAEALQPGAEGATARRRRERRDSGQRRAQRQQLAAWLLSHPPETKTQAPAETQLPTTAAPVGDGHYKGAAAAAFPAAAGAGEVLQEQIAAGIAGAGGHSRRSRALSDVPEEELSSLERSPEAGSVATRLAVGSVGSGGAAWRGSRRSSVELGTLGMSRASMQLTAAWASSNRYSVDLGALGISRSSLDRRRISTELRGYHSALEREAASSSAGSCSTEPPAAEWPLQSSFRPRASSEASRTTYIDTGGCGAAAPSADHRSSTAASRLSLDPRSSAAGSGLSLELRGSTAGSRLSLELRGSTAGSRLSFDPSTTAAGSLSLDWAHLAPPAGRRLAPGEVPEVIMVFGEAAAGVELPPWASCASEVLHAGELQHLTQEGLLRALERCQLVAGQHSLPPARPA